MANQLFSDGDVHEINGQTLECVGVSYSEVDGEKQNFSYTFKLQSEVEAQRKADAELQAKLEADEAERQRVLAVSTGDEEAAATAPITAPEPVSEPVNNQEEETQYVK